MLPLECYVHGGDCCFGAILQEPLSDGSWPIVLKNSVSADDAKILALIGREASVDVGHRKVPLILQPWAAYCFYERKLNSISACSHIGAKICRPPILSFSTELTDSRGSPWSPFAAVESRAINAKGSLPA